MKDLVQNRTELMNQLIMDQAEAHLGQDIRLIPMDPRLGISDYFIIMTARNKNHAQALADYIEEALMKEHFQVRAVDGYKEGSWILMDCEDTLVHIFTQTQRDYYDLEGIWDNKEALSEQIHQKQHHSQAHLER